MSKRSIPAHPRGYKHIASSMSGMESHKLLRCSSPRGDTQGVCGCDHLSILDDQQLFATNCSL
eukprot:3815023-Amphidinium_carterae.1